MFSSGDQNGHVFSAQFIRVNGGERSCVSGARPSIIMHALTVHSWLFSSWHTCLAQRSLIPSGSFRRVVTHPFVMKNKGSDELAIHSTRVHGSTERLTRIIAFPFRYTPLSCVHVQSHSLLTCSGSTKILLFSRTPEHFPEIK